MKNYNFIFKNFVVILSLIFPAVSCNPFGEQAASGIFKSANGGADWQSANAIKDSEASLVGLNVAKIDFDPQNSDIVFVGGYNDGLYKSEDAGGVWQRILSKIFAYDFAIDPRDSSVIYAGGFFAERGRVVKTEDGGKSWVEVYSEAAADVSVRSLALNPSQPNQLVIGNSTGSVIKSNDGGLTWKLVKNFEDRVNRVFWQNGQVYVLLRTKGLFKSSNLEAGEFLDLTTSLTRSDNFFQNFTGLSEQAFNQAHIDRMAPNLIYLTAGKGVFKTTDEGANWKKLELPGKHGPDWPVRAVSVARSSSNLVFVSVGNIVYKSTDGGLNWQTQSIATTGFVNYVLIDPLLPQIVYAGNYVSN